jgi:hypothetical protein
VSQYEADDVAECNDSVAESPEEMDHNKNMEQVDRSDCRDASTGRFTKGWKGGGRPLGSKDRFSVSVMEALEATFHANKEELLTTLASEKPDVFMGLIAKLLPTAVIQEDMMGTADNNSNDNKDIRITLVQQVSDATAITHSDIPKEVQGELLPPDSMH